MGPQKQARVFSWQGVVWWSSDFQAPSNHKWVAGSFHSRPICLLHHHCQLGSNYPREPRGVCRSPLQSIWWSERESPEQSHYIVFSSREFAITSLVGVGIRCPLNFHPKLSRPSLFPFASNLSRISTPAASVATSILALSSVLIRLALPL